jgi:hypothetical protein
MGTNLHAMKLTFKIAVNLCKSCIHKTLSCQGGYLNFSASFIKNVNIISTEKIKLWNKRHFVENKTKNVQHFF